ncbi:MAG: hypothetical protein H0U67_09055 [Gemmatimonadetes bacterium]|nr:hypothetical protein [Gemmatimonadota bacterium]
MQKSTIAKCQRVRLLTALSGGTEDTYMRSPVPTLVILLALGLAAPALAQAPAAYLIPIATPAAYSASNPGSPTSWSTAIRSSATEATPVTTTSASAATAAPRSTANAADSRSRARARATGRRAGGYCENWRPERFERNPSREEILCRYGVAGPGRFGLLAHQDVPVYQPATPMPGTHLAGVPGHAQPKPWETFEEWEWRVHRTDYPAHTRVAQQSLELLAPQAAARIMVLERRLTVEGIHFTRRETWRSPDRQAYLFQQGRSRPGAIATATLTSWHGQMDEQGRPAGRAVDYTVAPSRMRRFHQIANELGLSSYGADSNDPGHVYLPTNESIEAAEVQMLRLLPRVPVVTLATGLPVDRRLPAGGRVQLREAVSNWVSGPFIPYVVPGVVGALRAPNLTMSVASRGHLAQTNVGNPAVRGRPGR